ncbi:MAG: hypothetical protein V3V25_07370, partial [Paracoccaceae bacterium]
VYAGTLQGTKLSDQDIQNTAALIGGLAGFLASSGKAANVSLGGSIARSGITNNYLWHQQAEMLEGARSDLRACEARENCSPEALKFYRERIAYFEALDSFTDQQFRAECDANPTSAMCKAYVADALCAAEVRSIALCGGVPGFGLERWGYRTPTAMQNARMFEHGRDYSPGFRIAYENLQHQQDTLDLFAEYADSVSAVRGNDSLGFAIEMGVAAIGVGVLGRMPKGGAQNGLAGNFGQRQFQLSRAGLDGVLGSPVSYRGLNTAEKVGILREASNLPSGDRTLAGSATRAEATELGQSWVGPGYRVASDGKTLVSADGLRQYRPAQPKPNSPYATTGVQANFQLRHDPIGRWTSNAHLNILD